MGKKTGFILGAIIGGAAAAGAALLLSPKSGKEMRVELLEQLDSLSDGKATEYKDLAKRKSEEYEWVGETLHQRVDQAKLTSQEALEQFKERANAVSKDFEATTKPLIEKPEEVIQLGTSDVTHDLTEVIEVEKI